MRRVLVKIMHNLRSKVNFGDLKADIYQYRQVIPTVAAFHWFYISPKKFLSLLRTRVTAILTRCNFFQIWNIYVYLYEVFLSGSISGSVSDLVPELSYDFCFL
jgi:hypothetical protein